MPSAFRFTPLFIALTATIPFAAQADEEPTESPSTARAVHMAARDAFACPGMHAEWLDEKTVQCLKVLP